MLMPPPSIKAATAVFAFIQLKPDGVVYIPDGVNVDH